VKGPRFSGHDILFLAVLRFQPRLEAYQCLETSAWHCVRILIVLTPLEALRQFDFLGRGLKKLPPAHKRLPASKDPGNWVG